MRVLDVTQRQTILNRLRPISIGPIRTMSTPPSESHLTALSGALTYHGRPPTAAVVHARMRSHHERIVRAVLGLLSCWGLAIVAVFLPMLHFVLVPALLIGGIALGWHRLHERATIRRVTGSCPACGAQVDTTLDESLGEPIALRCEHCRRQIHARVESPETQAAAAS